MKFNFRLKPLELLALAAFPVCYWLTLDFEYGLLFHLLMSGIMVPYGIYSGVSYIHQFEQKRTDFSIESLIYGSIWLWSSFFAFRFIGTMYIHISMPLIGLALFMAAVWISLQRKKIIVIPLVVNLAYTATGIYMCYIYFVG